MVTKMLTLNTAHLSEKTLELLAYEAAWEDAGAHKEKKLPFIKVYCFGHPNVSGTTYLIDAQRDVVKEAEEDYNSMPKDLRRLLREAFVLWCDTIRLHDEAPIRENLPKYDCG